MARSPSSSAAATAKFQLPADHEGLELHGAPSFARDRNPRPHMGIPRGAARELSRDITVQRKLRMDAMKAAVIYEPGGPEVLKIESRPIPTPQAGEVLIRVKAFGLNRSELFTRQGLSP